jgi:hypothetical protein
MIAQQFTYANPTTLGFLLFVGGLLLPACLVRIVAGRLRFRPKTDSRATINRARLISFRSALEEIRDSLVADPQFQPSHGSVEPGSDLRLRVLDLNKRGIPSGEIARQLGVPLADARLLIRLSGLSPRDASKKLDRQELNNGPVVAI